MIRVDSKPQPDDFEERVLLKGQAFLQEVPRPRGKQWKNKEYWRDVIPDMMTAYDSICAYSSLWIKPDQPTIDHYISRDEDPNLAYDWSNFRLARWRINTRKKNHTDVLDPFNIGQDWFILDFTTFEIHPNPELTEPQRQSVINTRNRLDLNHSDYCDVREAWFDAFKNNIYKLREKSPFIAYEAERQGIL